MKAKWPQDLNEYKRQEEAAYQKYKPLVQNLTAPETTGLSRAVQEQLDGLKKEAQKENIRRERPQFGTSVGRW